MLVQSSLAKEFDVSQSLLRVMALVSSEQDDSEPFAEGSELRLQGPGIEDFKSLRTRARETWFEFLNRSYEGSLKAGQTLSLLVLSNQSQFDSIVDLDDIIGEREEFFLPKKRFFEKESSFFRELTSLLVKEFDDKLSCASFKELEKYYCMIHDHLLPSMRSTEYRDENSARDPRKQLVFDYRLLSVLKDINNDLFKLLQKDDVEKWELAWRVHDLILTVQQRMTASLDDTQVVVKHSLKKRLDSYLSRFRAFLLGELRKRRRRLTTALSENDTELARSCIQGVLYQLKPAIGGIVSLRRERALYEDLCRLHRMYISPVTRERSLAFSNHFNRLAVLLDPPSNTDNYKLGFKISDVEFQFLKRSNSIVLHTDCSGFIGRIYRELARIAGYEMDDFVVRGSGIIGSIYMIEPRVSKKIELPDSKDPLSVMKQGDFFYFERKIRGERQRHVVFFDRVVLDDGGKRVSLWEASPGGVKHRVKPLYWIMRWVESPYGAPRSGVYRMKEMDKIDELLARRGLVL